MQFTHLVGGLFATPGVVDVALMTAIVAVLAGMYRMRRYARAALVYNRHPDPAEQEEAP